jgi:hypothetical protein
LLKTFFFKIETFHVKVPLNKAQNMVTKREKGAAFSCGLDSCLRGPGPVWSRFLERLTHGYGGLFS